MNLSNMPNNTILLAGVLGLVTVRLYVVHRSKGYKGEYNESNTYPNISPLKHDMCKQFIVDFFPLLVLGLASDGPFFDENNIMGSKLTALLLTAFSFVVFYEVVQPYVLTRLPNW